MLRYLSIRRSRRRQTPTRFTNDESGGSRDGWSHSHSRSKEELSLGIQHKVEGEWRFRCSPGMMRMPGLFGWRGISN